MIDLALGSDEAIIGEYDNVTLNNNKILKDEGTLVLTNLRLVWVAKGLLGKTKSLSSYSISDVKVYDNRAQVILKESPYIEVNIYFCNSQLSFRLSSKGKARDLVNQLNKLVVKTRKDTVAVRSIPGTAFVAETIKGTVETFKNSLGIKKKEPVQIVKNCPSCGGSVSGPKGQIIQCPFCGSSVKIK